MFTTRAVIFLSLLSLFRMSVPVSAQDSATGSLSGTVFDPAGGRVAQAVVVIVNTGTASRYTAITNAEGRFALALLPPGDYSAGSKTLLSCCGDQGFDPVAEATEFADHSIGAVSS